MPNDALLTMDDVQAALAGLPGWEVRDGWLRRTFKTPGWPQTLMLAQTIGYVAEAAWHHPDLSLGYAQVTVKLQTHRVRGLTAMDIALAKKIDEVVLWKPEPGSPLDGYPKTWVH